MDKAIIEEFGRIWTQYFPGANLPIVFYYSDDPGGVEIAIKPKGWRCFVGDLAPVLQGQSLCFSLETIGCGARFLGFTSKIRPNFEYFLSCGIPGKLDGERYKRTPEHVKSWMEQTPILAAEKKYIVFKRWDALDQTDTPEVVIFFSPPDVLSGLYTWANFDETDPQAVIAPFGAGCASIVQYPLLESKKDRPKAVLGMFDVSARPRVAADCLSFAIPWKKFTGMVAQAEETFLTTDAWSKVRERL